MTVAVSASHPITAPGGRPKGGVAASKVVPNADHVRFAAHYGPGRAGAKPPTGVEGESDRPAGPVHRAGYRKRRRPPARLSVPKVAVRAPGPPLRVSGRLQASSIWLRVAVGLPQRGLRQHPTARMARWVRSGPTFRSALAHPWCGRGGFGELWPHRGSCGGRIGVPSVRGACGAEVRGRAVRGDPPGFGREGSSVRALATSGARTDPLDRPGTRSCGNRLCITRQVSCL